MGCKWRLSHSGLVRDGPFWSPMQPWNDGGISWCICIYEGFGGQMWGLDMHEDLQFEANTWASTELSIYWVAISMTNHLGEHHTIFEAILLDIAGKSGIAGIALWKYHGIPNCNWKHVMEIWSTNSWIASIKKRKSIYKLHGGSHRQCSQVIKQPLIWKPLNLLTWCWDHICFAQWESQNHIKRLQWLQNTDNWTLTYLTARCLQKEGRICSSHWFDGEELVIVGLQWVEHTHSLAMVLFQLNGSTKTLNKIDTLSQFWMSLEW